MNHVHTNKQMVSFRTPSALVNLCISHLLTVKKDEANYYQTIYTLLLSAGIKLPYFSSWQPSIKTINGEISNGTNVSMCVPIFLTEC